MNTTAVIIAITLSIVAFTIQAWVIRIKNKKNKNLKKIYREMCENYEKMEQTYTDILDLKEKQSARNRQPKKIRPRNLI